MKRFSSSEEAEQFFLEFMKSDYWKLMEEMVQGRIEQVMSLLGDSKTTSDGRAMLNGRLIELHYLKKSPENFLNFFQAQKDLFKVDDVSGEETLISKPSFPDIMTH